MGATSEHGGSTETKVDAGLTGFIARALEPTGKLVHSRRRRAQSAVQIIGPRRSLQRRRDSDRYADDTIGQE